ncbi:exoP [Deinococcus piscis]|uniref:ExoP n=1 Tax=Deinococcus piscis TaxID=394230 RepID=A0ABQ3KC05_9DEIO|nr:lipopolysaccharide biosynthesis protein [Deinococcus piscis]GHG11471.1 exoP [Deinococcus piscis]
MTQPTSRAQDLDVAHLLRVLRSALLPLLLVSTALAAATYFYSQSRPPVYQASAGVAALPAAPSNTLLSNSLVTAPGLPAGVVSRALRSPEVTADALARLKKALPDAAQVDAISAAVSNEIRSGNYQTVSLQADIDQNLVGNYEILARAGTPEAAKATANAFTQALLAWDRDRALDGVNRARANLTNQLDQLRGETTVGGQPVSQTTANQLRAEVTRSLQQLEVLRLTATGTLSLISGAVLPETPLAPRPLRDALLVLGAGLFFGLLFALLRDRLVQRIQDSDSLRPFGLPILGLLPPLPGRHSKPLGVETFMQHGGFREGLDFVRLGLLSSLGERAQAAGETQTPMVAVSSAEKDEGKSSVTAGLAMSCAARGMKVLVVDADIFRQRQRELLGGQMSQPSRQIGNTQFWIGIRRNIDLMTVQDTQLNPQHLLNNIQAIREHYDLILIDTPPALTIADTLALSRLLDGLLLVVSVGTPQAQVERLVTETQRLGVRSLGFALNRYRMAGSGDAYGYGTPLPSDTRSEVTYGS